jgi:hypothetical protein
MRPSFEKLIPPADASIRCFRRTRLKRPLWNYHPEVEIKMVESGAGFRFVGDSVEPYQSGDLVLQGSNLPHHWSSDQYRRKQVDCEHVVIVQFLPVIFGDIISATTLATWISIRPTSPLTPRCPPPRSAVFSRRRRELQRRRGCGWARLPDLAAGVGNHLRRITFAGRRRWQRRGQCGRFGGLENSVRKSAGWRRRYFGARTQRGSADRFSGVRTLAAASQGNFRVLFRFLK